MTDVLSTLRTWEQEPHRFYLPREKQMRFHVSPKPVRVFCGSNRSGKTWAGVNEMVWHSTGEYPTWYPPELHRKQPTRGRVVVRDFEKGFQDVVLPWINYFLPRRCIERIKNNSQGIPALYTLKNGSMFSIVTNKQESLDLAGWTGDWVWADEPFRREHWIELQRGLLVNNGLFWLTMTPIDDSGGSTLWMFDDLYQKSTLFDPDGTIDFILVNIWEGGNLTADQIQQFEGLLTEDEKMARIHGLFALMSGLVYKEMTQPRASGIVIEPFEIPDHWTRYCICDPHDRMPTFFTYLAASPEGPRYVYDEFTLKDQTFAEMADYLRLHEAGPIQVRLMDPRSGGRPSATSGTTPLQEFARHGIRFVPAPGDRVGVGHKKVKEWFRDQELLIFSTCKETIYQMQHYAWPRSSGDHAPSEKPEEKNKHIPDNLRYAAIYGADYRPPKREPDYRERMAHVPDFALTYPTNWMLA